MGYFSRDKLGPKAFYLNLKPVTVYLGPYMSHMVYYTPWGIIYQFGGGSICGQITILCIIIKTYESLLEYYDIPIKTPVK